MSKILVTGAGGLFGVNFCLNSYQHHQIIGITRRAIKALPFATEQADLLEKGVLPKLVEKLRPDVIIHAAANANLDDCEKDPKHTFTLNAELPARIAEVTSQRGIQLIHISTDAVFHDNTDRVFTEQDTPNPNNLYGQSKLSGEEYVLQIDPYAIVARVNFFGWSISGKKSLAEFFFNHLANNKPCFGFPDVFFCPLYVEDLGEVLIKMIDKQLAGLYHVVGSDTLSKYQFGQQIAQVFGYDINLISPKSVELSTLVSPRSNNLRLSNAKLSTALGQSIPGIGQGLDRFYTQFKHGYPQKIRTYQQS